MENHDIEDLINGKGVLNWEHSNKGEDIIGAVIYARKILDKKDCENDRQRKYWDFVKKPFVYIIGELFEDEEHPGAIAVAAMIRYYAKHGEKLLTGFSIEGATLERRDYILQESVGRRVAVTLRPCNHTAIAGLYEDPKAKKIAKDIEKMSKSIDETLVEVDSIILEDMFMPNDPVMDLYKALNDLNKTLEAGMGNVAPSQLTGQAALTREHVTGFQRNQVKAAIRDWDRKRPLKEVVKAALPEVDDDYLHHFEALAEELALKKSSTNKLIRVGASHSSNKHANEEQKKLIEGLYFDPKNQEKKAWNPGHSEYTNSLYKLKNDAGKGVVVKNPQAGIGMGESDMGEPDMFDTRGMDNARAASHYYHLANDVFGMGEHVPVTNYFQHKQLGSEGEQHHQAMEHVQKAKTIMGASLKDQVNMAKRHVKTGEPHKMMMMDSILGNTDRHIGNVLVGAKGNLINIDNDLAFSHLGNQALPSYVGDSDSEDHGSHTMHPEAAKWIKGIDAKKLVGTMMDQGHHPTTIKSAVAGLKSWQRLADKPLTVRQMWDHTQNQITSVNHAESQKQNPAEKQKKAV